MKQILLAYDLPKESVTTVMLLQTRKQYFAKLIVTTTYTVGGVPQKDKLTLNMFIICQVYILWMPIGIMI